MKTRVEREWGVKGKEVGYIGLHRRICGFSPEEKNAWNEQINAVWWLTGMFS